MERGRLKKVQGRVSSDKMEKTIVVKSERRVKHPRYGKYVRRVTTYYAHDEAQEAREGDIVELAAARPMSKSKRWRLLRVLTAREVFDTPAGVSGGDE